jgi:hypothetical protein
MSCKPGHPPRAPAFSEGNTAHLVHGAASARIIAAKAAEVHASLLELAPYLSDPLFAPQVSRYLEATAREQLLHAYVVSVSEDKGAGRVPQRLWEQATAATRLAAKLADQLGLSPRGHAELKAIAGQAEMTAYSLAQLGEAGAEILKARAVEVHEESHAGPGITAVDDPGLGQRENIPGAEGRVPRALHSAETFPRGNTDNGNTQSGNTEDRGVA